MFVLRWIASPPVAALITAALFAMMALMIRNPQIDLPPPKPFIKTDVTFEPEPLEVEPKPDRPVLPDQPPTQIAPQERTGLPDPIALPPQGLPDIEAGPGGGHLDIDPPIIKAPPQYPQSCASRGVEGVVIVQFDITPGGDVINPRIVESPDRCFRRTVLATISKYKYPPSRSGAMRRGRVETFNFQLVD